jgi:peptidoglycan/LPS O-acetylase OafA/YrhL
VILSPETGDLMTKKTLEIEALRGVAVGLVLIARYLAITPWLPHTTYNAVAQYFRFGDGVDLFFVISGYVVGQSLASMTTIP